MTLSIMTIVLVLRSTMKRSYQFEYHGFLFIIKINENYLIIFYSFIFHLYIIALVCVFDFLKTKNE